MVSPIPRNKVICHYRNALSMHTVYGRHCYLCEFTKHCKVEVKYLKRLGHQMDFEFLKCFQAFSIEINLFLPVNAAYIGLILSVPTNQRPSTCLTTMNEELLAASVWLAIRRLILATYLC
jgi:hypothetical protein